MHAGRPDAWSCRTWGGSLRSQRTPSRRRASFPRLLVRAGQFDPELTACKMRVASVGVDKRAAVRPNDRPRLHLHLARRGREEKPVGVAAAVSLAVLRPLHRRGYGSWLGVAF